MMAVFGAPEALAAKERQAVEAARELDAAIATEEATRRAAGYVCADFERHQDVSIRGRSVRADVFALPLARATAG